MDKGLLGAEGYATTITKDAGDALAYLDTMGSEFHLLLLDIGLPDESGLEVLRQLRSRNGSMPVIILTARAEVADKVLGLGLGANDYVTKPFALRSSSARIRAALRSAEQPTATELVVGDLRLDLLAKVAWRAGPSYRPGSKGVGPSRAVPCAIRRTCCRGRGS